MAGVLEVDSMQAEPLPFSWLREVVVPALFTIIGAVLGFIASQVRDDRKARQAKKAFLRAVGMELDALDIQLNDSLLKATESVERVKNGGTGARLDDPMMIEIIHFYSDLGALEQIYEGVKDFDAEYSRTTSDVQRPVVQRRLLSALRVSQEQISGTRTRLKTLRVKLPPAEQPK